MSREQSQPHTPLTANFMQECRVQAGHIGGCAYSRHSVAAGWGFLSVNEKCRLLDCGYGSRKKKRTQHRQHWGVYTCQSAFGRVEAPSQSPIDSRASVECWWRRFHILTLYCLLHAQLAPLAWPGPTCRSSDFQIDVYHLMNMLFALVSAIGC